MKVYNVIQTSNCDGEILVNVTPCADLHSAQTIMDDEIRTLGYCAECGSKITDEMDEYFYDDEGNFFCNCDCAMEYSGIHRLEI